MSVPDQKLVLPKQFDNVTKRGIRRDPKGFVTTLLGIEADEFEVIETEQLSMKTHVADSFIRVTTGDKQAIVHCEFQTHDSRDAPMPFRMAGYIGSAADLAILGGLAYDSQTIREAISEAIVQESSIIQYFTEKGIEQGKKQQAVEAILTVLEVRFDNDVAEELKPFLKVVDDLERLDQLHRVAARASDIDEFTQALLNLKNSAVPKV